MSSMEQENLCNSGNENREMGVNIKTSWKPRVFHCENTTNDIFSNVVSIETGIENFPSKNSWKITHSGITWNRDVTLDRDNPLSLNRLERLDSSRWLITSNPLLSLLYFLRFATAENIATRYDSFGLQTPSVILGQRKGHVFGTWKGPEVRGPTARRQHSLEDPRFWLGSVVAGILGPRRAPELRKGSVDRFNSENLRYSPPDGSISADARGHLLCSVRIGSCSDAHGA